MQERGKNKYVRDFLANGLDIFNKKGVKMRAIRIKLRSYKLEHFKKLAV